MSSIAPIILSSHTLARILPTDQAGEHVPYNGYMFRVLTSQGPHAPAEPRTTSSMGDERRIRFVAYPVEYRSSGVMTFIVDQSGRYLRKRTRS